MERHEHMEDIRVIAPFRVGAFVILACGMSSAAAQALPDDYLAAIKADAKEFATGSFVAPQNSAWVGRGGSKAADDGTASLAAFQSFLKKRFPGTHILYAKLADGDKSTLWKDYVKTGDLGRLRTNIFAIHSGRSSRSSRTAINNLPFD